MHFEPPIYSIWPWMIEWKVSNMMLLGVSFLHMMQLPFMRRDQVKDNLELLRKVFDRMS